MSAAERVQLGPVRARRLILEAGQQLAPLIAHGYGQRTGMMPVEQWQRVHDAQNKLAAALLALELDEL